MKIDVVSEPLALPPLAERALEPVRGDGWFPALPSGDGWTERARQSRGLAGPGWLEKLAPALEASGRARERIEKAAANGIVVTTGQQPGLFGGPLYTWFKALTALALADELERRTKLPVAPVFWAATDDSDFTESSRTVVSVPGGFEKISMGAAPERDTPMSEVPLPDVSGPMRRLAAACGSASNASVLDTVRAAYDGTTVGGAYVRMMRKLLEPLGIAVLDASHAATREAASPLLRRALAGAEDISAALAERTRAITREGLKPQVKPVAGRTLVFEIANGRRKRVRVGDAAAVSASASADALAPNVLLRPIVERAILPTVAYVAGPAELAYFAQVTAVADALDTPAPLAVPRWSGFLIEPHVARILEQLGAVVHDFDDPHALETHVAQQELPARVRFALDEASDAASRLSRELTDAAREANLPLSDAALEGAARQLVHKLERTERRLVAAVKRRGSDRLRAVATARGALFPDQVPQERALNMIPFIAKYGPQVLEQVLGAARRHVSDL